jgi:hypothetical protein
MPMPLAVARWPMETRQPAIQEEPPGVAAAGVEDLHQGALAAPFSPTTAWISPLRKPTKRRPRQRRSAGNLDDVFQPDPDVSHDGFTSRPVRRRAPPERAVYDLLAKVPTLSPMLLGNTLASGRYRPHPGDAVLQNFAGGRSSLMVLKICWMEKPIFFVTRDDGPWFHVILIGVHADGIRPAPLAACRTPIPAAAAAGKRCQPSGRRRSAAFPPWPNHPAPPRDLVRTLICGSTDWTPFM